MMGNEMDLYDKTLTLIFNISAVGGMIVIIAGPIIAWKMFKADNNDFKR